MGLKKLTYSFFFLFIFSFLSSCGNTSINGTYKENKIEKLDNTSKIEKDSLNDQFSPENSQSGTSTIKENINSGILNIGNENELQVDIVNLGNIEKIKKNENDKTDYEKLSNGVTIKEILQSTKVKIQNLQNVKYVNFTNNKDFINWDKEVFSKINFELSKEIFNGKTEIILKEKLLKDKLTIKTEYIEKTVINKDLKKEKIKILSSFYVIKNGLKIYKVDKELLDKYFDDKNVYSFYLNGSNEIYPMSENGISGFFSINLLNLLLRDEKAGILQYLPFEKDLLGINGINNFYINEHFKILEPYIKKILNSI